MTKGWKLAGRKIGSGAPCFLIAEAGVNHNGDVGCALQLVDVAKEAGADAVKVFPCSAVGGPKYLRALKAPLPQIKLIPTGGVSLSTAKDFIAAGAWALGVGADLVNVKAINSGERESVIAAARSYVTAVQEARAVINDLQ